MLRARLQGGGLSHVLPGLVFLSHRTGQGLTTHLIFDVVVGDRGFPLEEQAGFGGQERVPSPGDVIVEQLVLEVRILIGVGGRLVD